MSTLRRVVSIVITGMVAGCTDIPSQPDTSSNVSLSGGTAIGQPALFATGGGVLNVTSPAPAIGEAYFSFTVQQTAEGDARGRFHMVRPRAGFIVDIEGEVTCLSADPATHRVWVGGRVTRNRSTDPNHLTAIHEPGDDVWFRIVDNGEGANAAPDRSSVYGFEGAGGVQTSLQYCALQLWPAGDANAFAVIEGNIQVH